MNWSLILGVWGAVLSTVLALQQLLGKRPFIEVKRAHRSSSRPFALHVTNRAEHDIMICNLYNWRKPISLFPQVDSVGDAAALSINEEYMGEMAFVIPAGKTVDFEFHLLNNEYEKDDEEMTEGDYFARYCDSMLWLKWTDFAGGFRFHFPAFTYIRRRRLVLLTRSVNATTKPWRP